MERPSIPNAVATVVGEVLGKHYYNHHRLEVLFITNGAPGDPPQGSCVEKCISWLKRCNDNPLADPYKILGGVLEEFMEVEIPEWDSNREEWERRRQQVRKALANYGLSYYQRGQILSVAGSSPSRSLQDILASRDLAAVHREFERTLETVHVDPPASLTAACSLLEALYKVYIEDEGLELPSKESIKNLWKLVSDDLGFSPQDVVDDDLKRILSGLTSIVDGIGSLRTHASSAHGRSRKSYRIEPRHARLAIHSAHTLATFIIETWDVRKPK